MGRKIAALAVGCSNTHSWGAGVRNRKSKAAMCMKTQGEYRKCVDTSATLVLQRCGSSLLETVPGKPGLADYIADGAERLLRQEIVGGGRGMARHAPTRGDRGANNKGC